jgi:hypothetical protein
VKVPPEKIGRFAILQRLTIETPTRKKIAAVAARNSGALTNGKVVPKNSKPSSKAAARSAGRLPAGKTMTVVRSPKIASR